MPLHRLAIIGLTLLIAVAWVPTRSVQARSAAAPLSGLKLSVRPIVDVGTSPVFRLSARSWPGPATVTLRLVSPHHGFTGPMRWSVSCGCFTAAVWLAKRAHSLERGQAWAQIRSAGNSVTATVRFMVRGLAANGKGYAPGGTPRLTAWVSDPQPTSGRDQHYCAWVHASDAFGLAGVHVRFVVQYKPTAQTLDAGRTDANGLACRHQPVAGGSIGVNVPVDVYAGQLHVRTSFTPRS